MKAMKIDAKSFEKGDSKVTGSQKDRRKMGLGKRGFWIALNSLALTSSSFFGASHAKN